LGVPLFGFHVCVGFLIVRTSPCFEGWSLRPESIVIGVVDDAAILPLPFNSVVPGAGFQAVLPIKQGVFLMDMFYV